MSVTSNKAKARAVLESIETGNTEAFKAIHPTRYKQHNLGLADGLAGIAAAVGSLPKGALKARVVRVFGDGDHVFAHTEYDFFGPKIGFDVFRFEDGLIVEHWDNLREVMPANRSGRTQIDGPVNVTEPELTEQTRRIAREFVEQNWVRGENTYQRFIQGDRYLQHNPEGADGLSTFLEIMAYFKAQSITMQLTRVHKVLAEGNFALVMSEGLFGAGGGAPTSFYDLFRIEDGFIAEHWDVIEAIPPPAERRNTNGKF